MNFFLIEVLVFIVIFLLKLSICFFEKKDFCLQFHYIANNPFCHIDYKNSNKGYYVFHIKDILF